MHEIPSLLKKLQALYDQPHPRTSLDIDLMLDYTRQLYAELLGWRENPAAETSPAPLPAPETAPVALQPVALQPDPAAAAIQPEPPYVPPRPAPDPVPAPPPVVQTSAYVPGDIQRLIGINDKYQIISELFHNEKEAYDAAIQAINGSGSAAEATDWLHAHVSWNYNWSEEHDTVQLFYNLIGRFFAQRGQ